jgi:hypothetical protein
MRLGVIALLTALSMASTAAAQIRSPRQTTWRGTLTTTAGLTGTFIARTHLEELYLLDGELVVDTQLLHPGDYIRAEPGSSDARVWSGTGCTCVLVTSIRDELR